MTAPATAALRFLQCLWMGLAAGLGLSILAPLEKYFPRLWQLAVCAGIGAVWLVCSFGICGADLRFGYFAGALLGGFLWKITAHTAVSGCFSRLWGLFVQLRPLLLAPFLFIFHKIEFFVKFLFSLSVK